MNAPFDVTDATGATWIECSWCGELNRVGIPWCACGHRADRPRLRCNCLPCVRRRTR